MTTTIAQIRHLAEHAILPILQEILVIARLVLVLFRDNEHVLHAVHHHAEARAEVTALGELVAFIERGRPEVGECRNAVDVPVHAFERLMDPNGAATGATGRLHSAIREVDEVLVLRHRLVER